MKNEQVRSISFEEVKDLEVYNVEVKDNNNYYIDGVLVHNCIVDDPQNPKTSESEVNRKTTIDYYTRSLYNRLTPITLGVRIIIMQRLHENDLTGYLLANDPDAYRLICLPAEATKFVYPEEMRNIYQEGLLDPIRLSAKTLAGFRKTLGTRGYSGQYDQRPSPDEGGIIKKEWFDVLLPETLIRNTVDSPIQFAIDPAYTKKQENDPTGIMTYFIQDKFMYILDFIEVWLEFPELCKFITDYTRRYQYNPLSKIFIEPKASGKSIVQQLRSSTQLNVIESTPPDADKVTRANAITPTLEARRVRLIQGPYVLNFLELLGAFPNGLHDEAVDCLGIAVNESLIIDNPDFMWV
jgi:predicted phage terminase large subunit-like protein